MVTLYDSKSAVKVNRRFARGLTSPSPSAADRRWWAQESAEAEHDRWVEHLEEEARYAEEMRRVCGERRYGAWGGHMMEGAL